MNRAPLLALVLIAAAVPPTARAQAPKKPLPAIAPAAAAPAPKPAPAAAPSDPLTGLRVHLAALRSQPLTQPQAVIRVPQTVPRSSWMEAAHVIDVTHR